MITFSEYEAYTESIEDAHHRMTLSRLDRALWSIAHVSLGEAIHVLPAPPHESDRFAKRGRSGEQHHPFPSPVQDLARRPYEPTAPSLELLQHAAPVRNDDFGGRARRGPASRTYRHGGGSRLHPRGRRPAGVGR